MTRKRLLAACAGLVAVAFPAYKLAEWMARPAEARAFFAPRPGQHSHLVLAHQGGEGLWPTNTMYAMEQAVRMGADMLDMDVHLTKDDVLVVMHDETVDRTTDGNGAVRDMELEQLKRLDAGYRFSLDGGRTYPYRGKGLTVPTLEEVFRAFPDQRMGIEIKRTSPKAPAILARLVRRCTMQDNVLCSSFLQSNMDSLRREDPSLATAATWNEGTLFVVLSWLGLDGAYTPPFQALQIPDRHGRFQVVTRRLVAAARRRNLAVYPWTINDDRDMRRLLAIPVDGINTDYPDRLLEMVRSNG